VKFKIILLYDDRRAEIGKITEGIAREYCDRHGYSLGVYQSLARPDLPATYSVGEAIATEMELNPDVDWFFRLDADAIIVNKDYRLEELIAGYSCPFLASSDANGLCLGVFALKNSKWSAELLQLLSFLGEVAPARWGEYDQHNTFDQSTLKVLMRHFQRVDKHIALLPQNLIQNPRATFSQDAFIMHYWSSTGMALIAKKMRQIISEGWSRKTFHQWGEVGS
jgi:hypothetical protein